MSVLARGWSPSARQSITLRLFLGALLVANPLYIGVFNLDLTSTTYEVKPVSTDDGRITVGESRPDSELPEVECSAPQMTPLCAYERERLETGAREFDLEWGGMDTRDRFVHHAGGDTPYYERRVELSGSTATVTLRPVSARTVIEETAIEPNELSLRGRYALLVGSLKTDESLPAANHIIRTDDGYVMLAGTGRAESSSGDSVEALVSLLLVVAGFSLLWRTYRRLPENW
ncbi:hypothetical protein [Haladaptatus sp. CMSO5]|uniref:hypothetical protein n=1 Tax=Haladaptatus sp. CMSO5 TaxID=3120514 RepID=UPI002FCE079F